MGSKAQSKITATEEDMVQAVALVEQEAGTSSLSLGAHASLQAVYEAPASPDLLRRTLSGAISWQRRNETTVERALLAPNLAPQWIAALLAWGAQMATEEGERPLVDLLHRAETRPGKLLAVHVPVDVPGRVGGEASVRRTPADEPIVEAIAVVDLANGLVRQARLALTGVWRQHARLAQSARLLVGGSLDDDDIQQVAAAVEREVAPQGDFRGSADYRRAMAAVLTRRALEDCRKGASRS